MAFGQDYLSPWSKKYADLVEYVTIGCNGLSGAQAIEFVSLIVENRLLLASIVDTYPKTASEMAIDYLAYRFGSPKPEWIAHAGL